MIAERCVIAVRCVASMLAVGALALTLWVSPALADTPITFFNATPGSSQAGGHPDLGVTFRVLNRDLLNSKDPCACQDAKDVTVHLPAGFIGNPHATPQCSIADFSADACPIDSQVGIARVAVSAGDVFFLTPVYNMIPPSDEAGLLGFKIILFGTPQFTILSARTGSDYGLDAKVTSIVHGPFPLAGLQEVLWGVPADPSHDVFREDPQEVSGEGHIGPAYGGDFCDAEGALSTSDPNTVVTPCHTGGRDLPPIASHSPTIPFLQAPTTCDAPLTSTLDVLSYDGGVTHAESIWPQGTGCDQLSFNPSLYAQPTTTETDSPSGIDVNLQVPQQLSPTIPSPTELRGATVVLPPGFSINPNAADGKTACTDVEGRFGTEEEAHCPEFSKVGSLKIESSALPGPLPGYVYLGQPMPGNRYRIFLVADGFATHVKLAGTVTLDPITGQVTITFRDLPQSPLTAFDMHFFGSERGALATPARCGTYPVTTTFTPWDSSLAPQTSTQFFTLDAGPNGVPCPGPTRPFSPSFRAASVGYTAGAHSPFWIELTRKDGDQNLSALNVTTPPGLSATLAGIPYCSDAAIAAAASPSYSGLAEQANPSCPAASQIGTAVTGAGAGNHPVYVSGKVYLAGPYRGAPLSLAVITPAISGPYDLGNAVVRAALHVDPTSAQITAVSDPLPQILEGIPLRLRSIRIYLDRKNFTLNPTRCDPFSVAAEVTGDQGTQASLISPFQVANCAVLPFEPKLSLRLSGSTRRSGNPALHSLLTASPGEAGIARAVVTLPHSELLDNAHINNPCTRTEFASGGCPPGSVIGFAKAETPLLEMPLEGPVYLMSGFGHTLPDVVADLKGQIEILLDGRIDTVNGGLRTSFEAVPDAPVSKFVLNLKGGSRGLLVNSEPLCRAPQKVLVRIKGQNGATDNQNQVLGTPCGSKARQKRHLHRTRKAG